MPLPNLLSIIVNNSFNTRKIEGDDLHVNTCPGFISLLQKAAIVMLARMMMVLLRPWQSTMARVLALTSKRWHTRKKVKICLRMFLMILARILVNTLVRQHHSTYLNHFMIVPLPKPSLCTASLCARSRNRLRKRRPSGTAFDDRCPAYRT